MWCALARNFVFLLKEQFHEILMDRISVLEVPLKVYYFFLLFNIVFYVLSFQRVKLLNALSKSWVSSRGIFYLPRQVKRCSLVSVSQGFISLYSTGKSKDLSLFIRKSNYLSLFKRKSNYLSLFHTKSNYLSLFIRKSNYLFLFHTKK